MPEARARILRGLALALALVAVACSDSPPPPLPASLDPLVERIASDSVRIRWSRIPAGASIPVFVGDSPEAIDRSRPAGRLVGPVSEIRGLAPGTRPYFEVTLRDEAPRIVAERRLSLDGAHNFRDLGGYETTDHRSVRWGLLYRSDDLGELTASDLAQLAGLHLRWVCDLRTEEERAESPDRLPAADRPVEEPLEIRGTGMPMAELRRRILSGDLENLDLDELLIQSNRAFAITFAHRYRTLFQRIADPANLPALIHCTAGKDRTGFGAALILLALGVPRETVFDDYLATNHFVHESTQRTLLTLRLASFFRTDPDAVRPLFGVRREYLQAAFDAIDAEYGTLDAYLREGIGVTDDLRRRLRELLLR